MLSNQLKNLSDVALLEETKLAVAEERRVGIEVLHHLREIEDRRLFLDRGYPSLFEMCVREFKYSHGAAQRRISAMRLMKDEPGLEGKIESGAISLSVAAQVQTFLRAEKKLRKIYSQEERLALIETLENKSSREAEQELAKRNPEIAEIRERIRPVSENQLEATLTISRELMEKLNELNFLISHRNPELKLSVLLNEMADLALTKWRPVKKMASQN